MIYSAWIHLTHKIGTFQSRLLLTILYLVLLAPYGVIARIYDWSNLKGTLKWKDVLTPDEGISDLMHQ